MATLVLQTAGAALGSFLGPAGAAVGRAAGALIGNSIDRSLFGEDRIVEGSRLTDLTVQESREGAPIPVVFGRTRLSGQVIWATEFEEVVSEQEQGGKGGGPTTTTRTFSYFANFAVALCEGEISHVGRIWADGELIDTSGITMRLYRGSETQAPDSLIEAKQGAGQAPAYRGTAYVVFERLPLESFGNRLPQFSFEVVRAIGRLERDVKAVQLIPASSEFIYDTVDTMERGSLGEFISLNRHIDHAETDIQASLDELQAVCPNLENISIVSSWFGTDLRCGECEIRPRVEVSRRNVQQADWRVSSVTRAEAQLVSRVNGMPAFGGTPSDAGIIRTIQDIKLRGLKVTYNPFLMMDVPAGNELPDPYASDGVQPVYPWRGRITASIAFGLPETPDRTDAIDDEVAQFLGTASINQFSISGTRVSFSGGNDWGYRRFILHAAHLCKAAGGVDTFIIGSEMRGLTWLRGGNDNHPFVEGLIALAADVRVILGDETIITYGADWSEYFGYHPSDGSGDVVFHLDPLWSNDNIDAIAIDNYMPLSDWRDGDQHLDAATAASIYDRSYLQGNIAGGEGYDWFYGSEADRIAQIRSPISDGGFSKPWVFRYKDLVNWWSNEHFNRPNGIEEEAPTTWVPRSKPIIFTEFGCPAIDKGSNQPNVFFDPQSSESALPYFSSGVRDDAIQRAAIEAGLSYWQDGDNNPLSPLYGGRMVDVDRTYLWTWDARPFPAFPHFSDVWSDSENWRFGHWLNGRLGGVPLRELIETIIGIYTGLEVDASAVNDVVDGYVISDRTSARNALETLLEAFQIDLTERKGVLTAVPRSRKVDLELDGDEFVLIDQTAERTRQREQEAELPSVLTVAYQDIDADYRAVTCSSRRLVGESRRARDVQIPVVSSYDRVLPVAEQWLRALWIERDRLAFAVPQSRLDIEAGDVIAVNDQAGRKLVIVSRIDEGAERRLQTRAINGVTNANGSANILTRNTTSLPSLASGPPLVEILNLPLLTGDEVPHAPRIAASAEPWPGGAPVFISGSDVGFAARQTLERPASLGFLRSPLGVGPVGVFDNGNSIDIELGRAQLSGVDDVLLFSGRNVLAVQSINGAWEVLQFADAELIGDNTWRLSRLLRAQAGTEDAMNAGFAADARTVLINGAVEDLNITRAEAERPINLRVGLVGRDLTDQFSTSLTITSERRGLRPLSPVHLRAVRLENGDIEFSWIRRTRIDGDLWEVQDVPLGEESEEYVVSILGADAPLRSLSSNTPNALYQQSLQLSDFGELPNSITISVAQVSASEGPGTARTQIFEF